MSIEQEKALHDAGIWSGGDLGLDPENDPVVWVTDNGFEIKSHDVAVSSGTTTVSGVSYKYVTLGSWNWIIIGYSTKELNQSVSGHVDIGSTSYNDYFSITNTTNIVNKLGTDSTDAGSIIKSASVEKNARIYFSSAVSVPTKFKTIFTNAVADPANEIPVGCVLCLCAGTTGNSTFNKAKDITYYPTGELKTAMTNVYNSISSAAGGAIQSIELTSCGSNATVSAFGTYKHSEHLFPLAVKKWNSSQNFCVETYLDTDAKRNIGVDWWLRTGWNYRDAAYQFMDYGITDDPVSVSYGVRPAFVLKLY